MNIQSDRARPRRFLGAALAVLATPALAVGEDLSQAWNIALTVNRGLQAQQETSVAAGLDVKAAESARYVTIRSYTIAANLVASTTTQAAPVRGTGTTGSGSAAAGGAASALSTQATGGTTGTTTGGTTTGGAGSALGLNQRVYIFGPNQHSIPINLTNASFPLYTGGKLLRTVEAAQHSLNAQKSMEARTALDLKLTVAEAYIGVLRSRRNLETTRSNVEQLTSFTRDTRNRLNQQLAIRSDVLAAEVSLSNSELNEITARTGVETAYATYNRYLCRPLDAFAELDEISQYPADTNWEEAAALAVRNRGEFAGMNDAEARELTAQAIRSRPELANLGEQARSLGAQALATKATLRPQVSINGGFLFLGQENFAPQGNGYLSGFIDWTFTDSGKTRRQANSLKAQGRALDKQRADLAADVALQVRTRWLDLQTSRQRVPIARFSVIQAEENVKVVTDRYRQQLSTYTEVLDAETRRVQSLNDFYNAVYDENLAFFRLRRAVGDI